MTPQTLNSITVGKLKCFTGEYRFKIITTLVTQYKLKHQICYVLVNKSGIREYLKTKGLSTLTIKQVLCTIYQKQRHKT
jgi:hypothetical protein